jgi:hypothetical protein
MGIFWDCDVIELNTVSKISTNTKGRLGSSLSNRRLGSHMHVPISFHGEPLAAGCLNRARSL